MYRELSYAVLLIVFAGQCGCERHVSEKHGPIHQQSVHVSMHTQSATRATQRRLSPKTAQLLYGKKFTDVLVEYDLKFSDDKNIPDPHNLEHYTGVARIKGQNNDYTIDFRDGRVISVILGAGKRDIHK